MHTSVSDIIGTLRDSAIKREHEDCDMDLYREIKSFIILIFVFVWIHDCIIYSTEAYRVERNVSNKNMIMTMTVMMMKMKMKMTIMILQTRRSEKRSCRRLVARIKRVKLMSHIATMVPTLHIAKRFSHSLRDSTGAKTTGVNRRFIDKCRSERAAELTPPLRHRNGPTLFR